MHLGNSRHLLGNRDIEGFRRPTAIMDMGFGYRPVRLVIRDQVDAQRLDKVLRRKRNDLVGQQLEPVLQRGGPAHRRPHEHHPVAPVHPVPDMMQRRGIIPAPVPLISRVAHAEVRPAQLDRRHPEVEHAAVELPAAEEHEGLVVMPRIVAIDNLDRAVAHIARVIFHSGLSIAAAMPTAVNGGFGLGYLSRMRPASALSPTKWSTISMPRYSLWRITERSCSTSKRSPLPSHQAASMAATALSSGSFSSRSRKPIPSAESGGGRSSVHLPFIMASQSTVMEAIALTRCGSPLSGSMSCPSARAVR